MRRKAAIAGLAIFMGASFLGCHSGPRLFSRKDREERPSKQELADKDKGKFINRKKVRPEADYKNSDRTEEQLAKKDPKAKSNSKSSGSTRDRQEQEDRRIAATPSHVGFFNDAAARSEKTSAPAKAGKAGSAVRDGSVAKRDTSKRPVTDLLENSLFDEPLPNSRSTLRPGQKSLPVAKNEESEPDPFENVVVRPSVKSTETSVARVNYDRSKEPLNNDDADEVDEESEELEELAEQQKTPQPAKSVVAVTPKGSPKQSKFLPGELEEETVETHHKRTPSEPETASAISRRKQVQETINDWQRDLDESAAIVEEAAVPPTTTIAKQLSSGPSFGSKGHFREASSGEFAQANKAQGAVLNGELIIDTSSVPSRFQRTGSSTTRTQDGQPGIKGTDERAGRVNSNTATNIEIVPRASQNQSRSNGHISLQSMSDQDAETSESKLEAAVYETSSASGSLGALPSLSDGVDQSTGTWQTESSGGPRLMPGLDGVVEPAPAPPQDSSGDVLSNTKSSGLFGNWKKMTMLMACLASAVMVGLAWRRRMDAEAAAVLAPLKSQPVPLPLNTDDLAHWPRG